jgi:hypothetical protein
VGIFSIPLTVIFVPERKMTTPKAHLAQARALLSLLAGSIFPRIASYIRIGNEKVRNRKTTISNIIIRNIINSQ